MTGEPKEDPDDPTSLTDPDPTPHGGVSSALYFMDAAGARCPRSRAVACEIHEFDADGNSIFRTYGRVSPRGPLRGRPAAGG